MASTSKLDNYRETLDIPQTKAHEILRDLESRMPKTLRLEYEVRRRHDSPDGTNVNLYTWTTRKESK